jgi:hypothetical protein
MGPVIGTADIVIWGIMSGLKLAAQSRRAYVEATIDRNLTLPIPNFQSNTTVGVAKGYFMGGGRVYLKDNPGLEKLYQRVLEGTYGKEDEKDFIRAYGVCKWNDDSKSGNIGEIPPSSSPEVLLSWMRVRQWARESNPNPLPFQRVLGTLINVGIDFFANTPGAINEKSASGRALKGFLRAIDTLDFAQGGVEDIAKGMFLAAMETLHENASLLGADDKTEKLIEAVSKGLIQDVQTRSAQWAGKDLSKQEKIESWGQVVFRSMLGSVGTVVLSNPQCYLSVKKKDQQALISSVGTCILDTILEGVVIDPQKQEIFDLAEIFSKETLDKLIKTALVTLSEYPTLMGVDHKGLQVILTQIAQDLARSATVLSPDILPELMTMILEKTALNMEFLWPEKYRKDPAKHLLITASKELLTALSGPAPVGVFWAPTLSKTQVLDIVDVVLDEVVQNPAWLVKAAGKDSTFLGQAVEVTLASLRKVPNDRISAETGKEVVKAVIKAVAIRQNLLGPININQGEKIAVASILDTLIDTMLAEGVDPKVRWTLARGELFSQASAVTLMRMAEIGASESNIKKLKGMLNHTAEMIKGSGPWEAEQFIEELANIAA